VVIIAHNEEGNIAECLRSVAFADECIVVDHASTDRTVAIATAMGAHVLQTSDWPGFGPQKNRGLEQAKGRWVLSLDADERVSPSLAAEILSVIRPDSQGIYAMPRRTQFCGRWIDHCGWTPDFVARLFPRGLARFSDALVHECLEFEGPCGRLKAPLLHFSYPHPQAYWDKLQRYSVAWAEQRFSQGETSSMSRACFSGLFAFLKSYLLRLGFLDGALGLAVCLMQAQAAFGKHFHLYCLHLPQTSEQAPGPHS
jgi:glycosyltransferase involved in cell wall biosynthesis